MFFFNFGPCYPWWFFFSRFVRLGRAKRPKAADSGTDHWAGGALWTSEFEENDGELAEFLQTNTSFLLNMTKTAAFTESFLQ